MAFSPVPKPEKEARRLATNSLFRSLCTLWEALLISFISCSFSSFAAEKQGHKHSTKSRPIGRILRKSSLRTLVREGGYDSIIVLLQSLHLLTNVTDNPCQLICLRETGNPAVKSHSTVLYCIPRRQLNPNPGLHLLDS